MSKKRVTKLQRKTWHFIVVILIVIFTLSTILYCKVQDNPTQNKAIIFVYHSITRLGHMPNITPQEIFEREIKYLAGRYNIVSLNDLGIFIKEGNLPRNTVVLTFDNGIEDHYTLAYPILKKYNLTATFFIVTGFLENKQDKPELFGKTFLSWEQMREMQKNGMVFGAHTVNHLNLTKIPIEQAKKEIIESKKIIEEKLNTEIKLFAYPYGSSDSYNEHLEKVLKEAGFECSVIGGSNFVCSDSDLYRLSRFTGGDRNFFIFKSKLSGLYTRLKKLKTSFSTNTKKGK